MEGLNVIAFNVAMRDDGSLWIATCGGWERLPLLAAGFLSHEPVNAFLVSIARPEWAIDFYRLSEMRARLACECLGAAA